jgi:signal transduction histidine kinase
MLTVAPYITNLRFRGNVGQPIGEKLRYPRWRRSARREGSSRILSESSTMENAALAPSIHRLLKGASSALERIERFIGGENGYSPAPSDGRISTLLPRRSEEFTRDSGCQELEVVAPAAPAIPRNQPPPKHKREWVNIPAIAEELAAKHAAAAEDKGVGLEVDVEPDALVIGDRAELRRVFEQLLVSALEKTPGGGRIKVSAKACMGTVRVAIHQIWPRALEGALPETWRGYCGRGMNPRLRGFAFQPNFVSDILRSHSGGLDVSHLPGEGSRFLIQLPVT